MYLPSFENGTPAALDLAITSPQRQGSVLAASLEAGAAAKWYEGHKRNYQDTQLQCEAQGVTFLPVVAERSGGWGPTGLKVLRKVAKAAAARTASEPGVLLSQYLQGLSVSIRRSAARAVLKRSAPQVSPPLWQQAADVLEAMDAA